MSYPFGGHPKFGIFKEWAKSEGIDYRNGTIELEGRSVKITTFILPNGTKVPVADVLDGEFMPPSLVARLERRLDKISPFASLSGKVIH